mmetsp:Transcript_23415/g.57601  ORF Transcript_23415/g.57601 Transcript_23415/m.57601 type:complete len:339 (+) Transcript_23415:531-1547(+)
MYPEDIKTKFSLLQLLPPNLHDKGLADHIRDDANVQMQEAMDEHVTKLAAKKTHLYAKGRCSSISDVEKVIANLFAFADYVISDFDLRHPPHIVKLFDTFMDALSTHEATAWKTTVKLDDVHVSVLQELNTIFQVFAAQATDLDIQKEAKEGNLPRPELFLGAENQLRRLLEKVTDGIQNSRRPDFPKDPFLAKLIACQADNKRGRQETNPPPDSSPATKRQKPASDDRTTLGLVVYKGRGRPPMPDFQWQLRGVACSLCFGFLFVGVQCNNRNCPMIHISARSLAKRSGDERNQLRTYVKDIVASNTVYRLLHLRTGFTTCPSLQCRVIGLLLHHLH